MAQVTDIVHQLLQRDERAFELVFRTYYAELCRFANKYLKSESESEELVQDLFCKLWQKLETISIQSSLKSYLYTAVRNAAFNHLKHRLVQQQHELHVRHQADYFETTAHLEVSELSQQIQQAIDRLPDRCKEVFQLSRNEGLKYREIAEHMDISVKTVEAQMGKALSVLREELGPYLPVVILIWFENLMR
ncbi:MAG: RNA polymerase sigma-70 factor [Bacteroidetes bacterium]|nr:RNA polymerase sigma-70 factor [Bacteroidota bacterium]